MEFANRLNRKGLDGAWLWGDWKGPEFHLRGDEVQEAEAAARHARVRQLGMVGLFKTMEAGAPN